jgi:cell division protein FtsI/penicillin-binding protein 2
MTYDQISGFQAAALENSKIRGVWFEEEYKRVYPNGSLAADVIGFSRADNEGQYGLEEYYNDVGCPWITQYDFWRELYYFHKYVGVSNAFALYTATLNSAVMAGIGDVTGSVEAGKCADLIVTKNNPLDDLRALRNVDLVMARGRLYNNPRFKTKNIVTKELDKFCDLC